MSTSALPEQTRALFEVWALQSIAYGRKTRYDLPCVPTGRWSDRLPARTGITQTGWHPAGCNITISFADLSRRDFTVNAMAYNPHSGLIDPFGGRGRGARSSAHGGKTAETLWRTLRNTARGAFCSVLGLTA